MAKIPWWIWLGVGIGMFAMSYRIGETLQFFLYVGMLFIIIGIFKLLVAFIVGGRGKRAIKESKELRKQELSCPRCMSIVASDYTYCPHCGTRMR